MGLKVHVRGSKSVEGGGAYGAQSRLKVEGRECGGRQSRLVSSDSADDPDPARGGTGAD